MRKLLFISLVFGGCTDERAAITGTQSLAITVVAPTDVGSPDNRLPDTQRSVTIDISAIGADNQLDTSFDTDVQVYAQFLGTLSPKFGETPLATLHVTGGVATGQTITLPSVFGPTILWIDDGAGLATQYIPGTITGNSPTLWFREPFIVDLQRPTNEMALDALAHSPLEDKQITVQSSRHGAVGRLVVTSVFAQGYTVSDLACADATGAPPCTAGPYDHAMVFTFSSPKDQNFDRIELGQVIAGFAGGQSEFNGLTEIGFPQTFAVVDANGNSVPDINLARLPAPVVFEVAWFAGLNDPNGEINFERNEAAPIEVRGGKVCDLDDDFDKHKQWKLDPSGVGGDCSQNNNVINVVTSGVVSDLDPATLVGKTLPRVVGVLRPVFNNWIIFPRGTSDLTLQ
ncbi:MAG: hypothetical protein H6Q90_5435 [Deltaproteobacteria bacterium]|nr:hypothetical protein [Deltaproteobacteria bacterium]